MNTGLAHRDGETPLRSGPPWADAAALAVLVHGRGRSAEEMRALAGLFDAPEIAFLFPEAAQRSWYPERFMAPLGDNQPALSQSLAVYAEAVDTALKAGFDPRDIILGGFSQGACLTAEFVVRNPRPYGAVLIFTGGLIGPPGTRWPEASALRGVPVYLTGSTTDEWVPVERVKETARAFERSGARVNLRIFEGREHTVCDEEISAARATLAAWRRQDNSRKNRRAVH